MTKKRKRDIKIVIIISQVKENNRRVSCFRDIGLSAYWGHEFDNPGPRDVIGHVTIRLAIGRFLLVVLWNQALL